MHASRELHNRQAVRVPKDGLGRTRLRTNYNLTDEYRSRMRMTARSGPPNARLRAGMHGPRGPQVELRAIQVDLSGLANLLTHLFYRSQ